MSNAVSAAMVAAFAGLVGGRVHVSLLPDRTPYPAIRLTTVTSRPDNTLLGQTNVTYWLYRVDIWANTTKECAQIAASVKSIMRHFAYRNTHQMEMDGYEPETRVCRRTLDFSVSETEDPGVRVLSTPAEQRGPLQPQR